MSLVIGVLTFILVITSLFLVLVVLMQRAKTDGGIGAAMAGGATESAFGAETNNVLTGATIKAAIVFFVLSFGLYLANIYQSKHQVADETEETAEEGQGRDREDVPDHGRRHPCRRWRRGTDPGPGEGVALRAHSDETMV